MIAVRERRVDRGPRDNDLAADDAGDRFAVVWGDRRKDANEFLALGDIELPADPEERESLPHEGPVAHLCVGGRIEAARSWL